MADEKTVYRVKKSGTTVGGRVYAEGDTFGYADLEMRNRDRVWGTVGTKMDWFEEYRKAEGDDEYVAKKMANVSPSQPQGGPDAPLAGDSAEARAAKQFKNMETAGVVSQVAGLQENAGRDVEAMAERADVEEEARGAADPKAKVEPMDDENENKSKSSGKKSS